MDRADRTAPPCRRATAALYWALLLAIGSGCADKDAPRTLDAPRSDQGFPAGAAASGPPRAAAPAEERRASDRQQNDAGPGPDLTAGGLPDLSGEDFIAQPGPEHEQLWNFLGEWEGEEEYPDSPYIRGGGKGKGRFSFTVMHNIWLSMDYNTVVTSKAGKDYHFGYNAVFYFHRYKKTYQQWLFHHLGEGEYSEGRWDKDHFYFESHDPMIGLPHGSRYTYTAVSDNEFRLRVDETFNNAKWDLDMIGNYKRIQNGRSRKPKGTTHR